MSIRRKTTTCVSCIRTIKYYPRLVERGGNDICCADCSWKDLVIKDESDWQAYLSVCKEQGLTPDESLRSEMDTDKTTYWSGLCHECECEWTGMEDQNCCPQCKSDKCDLMEESEECDGIVQEGRLVNA